MKAKKYGVFTLPALPTLLIVTSAAALLIYVLSAEKVSVWNYVAYLYSTYALLVGLSGLRRLFRWLGGRLKNSRLTEKLHRNPILAAWLDDPLYRTKITLYASVLINAIYIAIKLVSGIYYRSDWLIAFALYYVVLTMLRVSLANYVRRHQIKEDIAAEYRRYRRIGWMLLTMNLVLSIIVARMVGHSDAFQYPGVLIYAMATYTFYAIILAVINLCRFRRHGSPVASAVKVVNLTAAMMAMLSLEAAMLSRFGEEGESAFRARMIGISGLVVSLIVLGMSVYMVVHATKKLKMQEAQSHE